MNLENAENPCLKKKGTLVITIEPCTKGKETETDETNLHHVEKKFLGLPRKTPRTMEIEIEIKGKNQEFSPDESSNYSSDELLQETEIISHFSSIEREKLIVSRSGKSSFSSVVSEPKLNLSCRTVALERKPCSKTCPGPIICLPHKHFLGDNCKLHDPTVIGNQILQMHKNGVIQKQLYNFERIYPQHIIAAISEITQKQTKKKVDEGIKDSNQKKANEVFEKEKNMSGDKIDEPKKPLVKEHKKDVEATEKELPKKNRAGCFC